MLAFFKDVIEELKKLQVPSKKETYVMVVTILLSTLFFALLIMLADFLISKIIKLLFGLGV